MRQPSVFPFRTPAAQKIPPKSIPFHQTFKRGIAVLSTPLLNKGTAFTAEERESLDLTGLLPSVIGTLESQVAAAYLQYQRLPGALSKNIYLTALHDRNEVLFFRLLCEHLREMTPIVNDRTVGLAMEKNHHECRRPRGVYLSIDDANGIEEAFRNLQTGGDDVDLILGTDAEQIFGIGDWGVGGIEIAIGKLALYTAAGGIDPERVIPVMLDVGTNRESLLADPMYPGTRHARVRGQRYDDFIDAYVTVVKKLFPKAVLQWEAFSPGNARRILEKYRTRISTFSDDLQGAGAITLAATVSAMRICGTLLKNQRIVIFGAGTTGVGVADLIRDVMIASGLSPEQATRRFWFVDIHGLLVSDMGDKLLDFQAPYARSAAELRDWRRPGEVIGLADVIRRVRPTILIGASGTPRVFTEAIVKDMARYTERPIIFPLSSPPPLAEATPADLIAWTDGRALIAAGSPFAPVTHKGITHVIGQTDNAMLYPGVGLGAIVSKARLISVGMLEAAANALSSLVAVRLPGASLLPLVDNFRSVTATVAVAVAEAAAAEGLAEAELYDTVSRVDDAMWKPEYRRIKAC
ncbi:MAG: NAD-dependent malic enzyme [Acidobacteriota bacterium]